LRARAKLINGTLGFLLAPTTFVVPIGSNTSAAISPLGGAFVKLNKQ